jgi:CBS domain-containing protein
MQITPHTMTMTVTDVMSREVVTAEPSTPFKDLVDLMLGEGVSALPIVDRQGTLVGLVSEGDLLCKEEHADRPAAAPSHFARHQLRMHWRKATGLTAADVLTSPVLTATPDEPLPQVARRLAQSGVRRLCVVDGGRLVGIVARRDVLRPFLRGDREIQRQIETDVLDRALHTNPGMVRATVEHGVVVLTGRLEYQGDALAAGQLAGTIPGVVAVRNRLDWQWNGPGTRAEATAAMG